MTVQTIETAKVVVEEMGADKVEDVYEYTHTPVAII